MVIISLIILFTDNSVCLSSEIATKFFLKKGIVFSQPTEYAKKRALKLRDHLYKQNLTLDVFSSKVRCEGLGL